MSRSTSARAVVPSAQAKLAPRQRTRPTSPSPTGADTSGPSRYRRIRRTETRAPTTDPTIDGRNNNGGRNKPNNAIAANASAAISGRPAAATVPNVTATSRTGLPRNNAWSHAAWIAYRRPPTSSRSRDTPIRSWTTRSHDANFTVRIPAIVSRSQPSR